MATALGLATALWAAAPAAVQPPAYKSGLDLGTLDRAVRPQDDLYRFVNGGWLDTTEIPADRVTYGTFVELGDRAQADIHRIIEEASALPNRRRGSPAQQVGDLYASMIDEPRIEALGIAPLKEDLDRIDRIRTSRDVATETGYLASIASGGPFPGTVTVDAFKPGARIVQIGQGGTLLPEREYYFKQDAASIAIRQKYEAYLATIFTLVGRPSSADEAHAVLAFETGIARGLWAAVDSRRPLTTANRFSLDRMVREMPGFDWVAWARPQGLELAQHIVLTQPSFFKGFAAVVAVTPVETLKAWLRSRLLTASSSYLTQAFNDARFDFFGRVLTGQETPNPRWRRGVSLVNGSLGDAVGQLYVEKHFPPAAKVRVEAMVARILKVFREALKDSEWMTEPTKRRALEKLGKLRTEIGYPPSWRDYSRLTIKRDDLFGNVRRINTHLNAYRMDRLAERTDPGQWLMTVQAVNAYYAPATNEIAVPAGILRPPLFNAEVDDAENYGSIGAILGHEAGHGFDQNGRIADGSGNARDWWTPEDAQAFEQRVSLLVRQFDAFEPLPGMHISGELTRIENIGDLGGLTLAFRAYKESLGGQPSPVIGGFTGEQRFFMSWARTWRSKEREAYLRQWLAINPYAPARYRANGPVSNMPEFYEAFGVKPGDKLYRREEERVRIW
jgi:predicted metalloendopeptidase